MATYYVDPAATGANDGSSQEDAWTSLQSAADGANAAGDIVYCKGTQNTTASIDFDTNSGDGDQPISFIGCNDSWVEDGTRFTINGNSQTHVGIDFTGTDHLIFKNIAVTDCTDGFSSPQYGASTPEDHVFINCYAYSNSSEGFELGDTSRSLLVRCVSDSNSSHGFRLGSHTTAVFCRSTHNGGDGFNVFQDVVLIRCISHGNTGDGVDNGTWESLTVYGCTIDDNGSDGVDTTDGTTTARMTKLIMNRITNNDAYGIRRSAAIRSTIHLYTHFYGNASGETSGAAVLGFNSTSMAGDGYTDDANNDFNLTVAAEGRNLPINLDP